MPAAVASVIGLALFNIGVPLAIVNAAVFATPFLLSAAASIGLSLASNALLRLGSTPAQPASVKPSDGQQSIKQAIPPRWKHFGLVRTAGPVWWLDSDPATGFLYLGITLNQGRIGEIVGYHIDDSEVTIDGSGNILTAPYSSTTTKILTRLGLPTETKYSEINSVFGVDEVRGDGVATALLIADGFATAEDQLKNYPAGVPRFRLTFKASVVWDPRFPAQLRTDPDTWQWSENPVVCLLAYMLDPDGYGLDWSDIESNIADWIAAADICDEPVLSIVSGGYEARYRIAGSMLLTDKPATVVSRFCSTFDGRVWVKADGSFGVIAGKFRQPEVALNDDVILDWKLTYGQDPSAEVAGIRAQYQSRDHDYREQDADPWPTGEAVLALGEDRAAALDLLWVPSHSQARRLMKRAYLRENAAWRGTIRTNLAGLRALDERYVRIVISKLGIDRAFEISRWQIDPNTLDITLEVLSVDPAIDNWNPATEEGTPATQPILTAFSGPSMTLGAGSSGILAIRQVIDPVASGNQVRMSFGGHPSQGMNLTHVSLMTRSGATANGTAAPVPVLFGGAVGIATGPGDVVTSDWLDFPVVAGTDLLVHMEKPGGAGYVRGADATASRYQSTTADEYDDAVMTVQASGPDVYFIIKMEVRAGA